MVVKVKKIIPTEHQEQEAVVQWWAANRHVYGYLPDVLMAIPNGSHKSMAMAAKFKREGLRPGAPDLFLAVQKYALGGLFLEMKRMNWKPPRAGTKAHAKYMVQQSFHEMLQTQNYRAVFCAGHNAAINEIQHYLKT